MKKTVFLRIASVPGENTNFPIDTIQIQFFATSVLHPSQFIERNSFNIREHFLPDSALSRPVSSRKEIVCKALYTEYNLNAGTRVLRVIIRA